MSATQITLPAGQTSRVFLVSAGERVTTTGAGKIQYTLSGQIDINNGFATWIDWSNGSAAGFDDAVIGMYCRAIATSEMTVVVGDADTALDGIVLKDGIAWKGQRASTAINLVTQNNNPSQNVSAASLALLQGSGYARTRAKLAAVRAGTPGARLRVAVVGTSLSCGVQAFGATAGANADGNGNIRGASLASLITAQLRQAGLMANDNAWFGNQNIAGAPVLNYYDGRITTTGTVTFGGTTLGGNFASLSAAGTILFQPNTYTDSCDVWYPTVSGNGNFSMTKTGDTGTGSVSQSTASNGFAKSSMLGGLRNVGTAWTLNWVSGATNYSGMEAWDSTVPEVTMINCGAGGYSSANLVVSTQPYSYLPALQALAPDLIIFESGANEWLTAVGTGPYTTNLATLLASWSQFADVIVESSVPSARGTMALATQENYIAILLNWAQTNGFAVNDTFHKLGSQEAQVYQGFGLASSTLAANPSARYSSGAHCTINIYRERAAALANMILSI